MNKERSHRVVLMILLPAMLCAWLAASARAADDALEYVHALQERGYGDMAVEYLKSRKEAGTLDGLLAEVYDAEMASSLRVAARASRDEAQVLERLAAAGEHVRNCLKRDPRGLAAARLMAVAGQIELDKAALFAIRGSAEEDVALSRAALLAARDSFARAAAICQEAIRAPAEEPLPAARPQRGKPRAAGPSLPQQRRTAAETLLVECRMNMASADMKLAMTYANANDPQREKRLRSAADGFNSIFQENRGNRVGLAAHFWQGKTAELLGNRQEALDVFDEVLAVMPKDAPERAESPLDEIFAEAERSRLAILAAQDAIEDVAKEAADWLAANPVAEKTAAYGGIQLERAKALILLAAAKRDEKTLQLAVRVLGDAAKAPGAHQREALLLEDRYGGKGGNASQSTVAEAAAMGDAALNAGVLDKAIAAYQRALELGKSTASPDELLSIRYRLAKARLMAGQWQAAAEEAEAAARQNPKHPQAPAAAALAVRALGVGLDAAKDRAAIDKKMGELIALMAQQWPDRSDADEARLAWAETALGRGDLAGATKLADLAAKGTHCRGEALLLKARIHWQSYLAEKRKPREKRDEAAMALDRRRAVEICQQCARDAAKEGTAASGVAQRAALLAAEFQLESGEAEKALKTLEPLEPLLGDRAAMPAPVASRLLKQQIVARLALGDARRAAEAALRLMDVGDDSPGTNGIAADALRTLSDALKAQEAPEATQHRLLQDLAARLAARKNHSLAGLAALAGVCAELNDANRVRAAYTEILDRAAAEKNPSPAAKAAIAQARGWRVAILREEKKYEEALREADRLVSDNPQYAQPLMEKARVLQAWAETKPALYDDALAVWTTLRLRMARMPKKPPEYYEAIYNAAFCLVQKSSRGDASALPDARQLLKSALVLNPELDSPDRVAKYKALLEKTRFLEKHRLSD